MKVLHIAAHLGGGIGKAHAALARLLPAEVKQTFLLLQEPIDRRGVDTIKRGGGEIIVGQEIPAGRFDVVQYEYWASPLLHAKYLDVDAPKVIWVHISGFGSVPFPDVTPYDRVVLSSPISKGFASQATVINSGFGFEHIMPVASHNTGIAYLGTVDFKKLHPDIFRVIDALPELDNFTPVQLFGHVHADVLANRNAMQHPQRAKLRGHTLYPQLALRQAGIFLYLLQPFHYGTAENALVEAMSLGLVPVVYSNPAEMELVKDGETGLVVHTMADAVKALVTLLADPFLRQRLSLNAIRFTQQNRRPGDSANAFVNLWASLVRQYA